MIVPFAGHPIPSGLCQGPALRLVLVLAAAFLVMSRVPASSQQPLAIGSPFRATADGDRSTPGVPSHIYDPYSPPTGARVKAMTGEQIIEDLGVRGFTDVQVLWRRGRTYLCEAFGPNGERLQLVVDALTADVIGVQFLNLDP